MIGKPSMTPNKAISVILDAFGAVGSLAAPLQHREGQGPLPNRSPTTWMTLSRSILLKGHDNDPSAGSPCGRTTRINPAQVHLGRATKHHHIKNKDSNLLVPAVIG